ncbi:MAG: FAD-dependent oxidoreductase [Syntrophomonadaceae bacterium]
MSEKIINLDAKHFDDLVVNSDKPVLVGFFSEDSLPCQVLAPILEKLAERYGSCINFARISRQDNIELAQSLNVTSSPTVLFYKDGNEVGKRLNGFLNITQVKSAIEDVLDDIIPPIEPKEVSSDVVILGAGPAGLSAAIYTARAKLQTIVVDISVPGGQAASSYNMGNYPGTPGVIKGTELIANMREQALSFGARIDDLKEVVEIDLIPNMKTIRTADTVYKACAVVVATGARPRALPAEGADEFKGRGVHYCATCDGALYEDAKVIVVGGGNSAVEGAVFLTRFASQVTIIHQLDHFQASKTAQDEALANPKIDVIWNTEIRKVNGQGHSIQSVQIENVKTHEISELPTDGIFVYIGTQPASDWLVGQLALDDSGYVIAGEDTVTNVPGVFAAGDIRTKPLRQVVTAAADGAVAGIMAEKHLASQGYNTRSLHLPNK